MRITPAFENYLQRTLGKLVGGTITGVTVSNEDFEEYVGLVVKLSDGTEKVVWFLRDEEGNGPGAWNIQNK